MMVQRGGSKGMAVGVEGKRARDWGEGGHDRGGTVAACAPSASPRPRLAFLCTTTVGLPRPRLPSFLLCPGQASFSLNGDATPPGVHWCLLWDSPLGATY